MRALRVFGMVSSILRQSFLQTGIETWEEICEYLERAQLHPTGRHWVDNLITPTLVAHQLIRSEREGDWLRQEFCIKRLLPFHRWTPQLCKVPLVALSSSCEHTLSPKLAHVALISMTTPSHFSICTETRTCRL